MRFFLHLTEKNFPTFTSHSQKCLSSHSLTITCFATQPYHINYREEKSLGKIGATATLLLPIPLYRNRDLSIFCHLCPYRRRNTLGIMIIIVEESRRKILILEGSLEVPAAIRVIILLYDMYVRTYYCKNKEWKKGRNNLF